MWEKAILQGRTELLTGEDKCMVGQTDEQNSAMVFTRESAHLGGGVPSASIILLKESVKCYTGEATHLSFEGGGKKRSLLKQ